MVIQHSFKTVVCYTVRVANGRDNMVLSSYNVAIMATWHGLCSHILYAGSGINTVKVICIE